MSRERLMPQLVMVRADLKNLPSVELPDGYALRHFVDGDDQAWETITAQAFGRQDNPDRFDERMRQDPAFRPQRVLFITHNDVPVATASAWERDNYGVDTGYLHMVSVLPGYQGKRLGYWINLAVLHQFVTEHKTRAALQTDDNRLAALKTYLRLGFEPHLVHENQRERWRKIYADLGMAGKDLARLEEILSQPIEPIGTD